MSAGRTRRHTTTAKKPASEGSFSLAEFTRRPDPVLKAFYERLPSDPHRNFIQALSKATPQGDAETYFALPPW